MGNPKKTSKILLWVLVILSTFFIIQYISEKIDDRVEVIKETEGERDAQIKEIIGE